MVPSDKNYTAGIYIPCFWPMYFPLTVFKAVYLGRKEGITVNREVLSFKKTNVLDLATVRFN